MKHIKRRDFIGTLAVTSACTALAAGGTVKGKRPNILYIFTDQQTATAMSCAGNKWLKTPGMDRIAELGVRFENAYCTQPLCGPSRTSMFSGLYPHQTGADINMPERMDKIRDNPMLGRLLTDSGYDCGYFGKWHIASSPKNTAQNGFRVYKGESTRNPKFDHDVAKNSLAFINEKRDKPFFCVASMINPHNVCEWARGGPRLLTKLPNCVIPKVPAAEKCPSLPPNFAIPENEPDKLRWLQQKGPSIKMHYPTATWGENTWRKYLWAYYRMVEDVDRAVKSILDGLEDSGQLENTLIIFTSDHGEGCASHHWNQKQVLYENVLNIPYIAALPGKSPAGTVNKETLISNGIDLMPTLLDYAGVSVPGKCDGISLRGAFEGRPEEVKRNYIVCETVFAQGLKRLGLEGRCLRTPRWKYIVYDNGELREQLFDMQNDRGETRNLAAGKSYAPLLQQIRSLLIKWSERTGDNRFPFVKS